MAIRKISEFVEASSPQNSDKLLIERNGSGKSITVGNLLNDVVTRINSGIGLDLLWEHANPNAGSAEQNINLDLSNYKLVYIIFLTWVNNNSYVDFLSKIDNKKHCISYFDSYGNKRDLTIRTNGITFGDNLFFQNYGGNSSVNNAGLVPYQIYGVK